MSNRKKAIMIIFVFSIFLISTAINQTILTSAILPPPTYLSPANGSYTNDDTPTFTWSAVSGAVSYTIEYGLDSSFVVSIDFTVPASQTYYTPSSGLDDNLVYWHVKTNDPGPGNWGPTWTLTLDTVAPGQATLQIPADNTQINDSTPFYDWGSVTGANEYRILVDDDDTFESPFINATTSVSQYQTVTPLPMSYHHWKVQARDRAHNYGPWSEVFGYFLDLIPPGAIALSSPSNNSYSDDIWAFDWSTDPGADLYYVEYGNNAAFDIVVHSALIDTNIYDPNLPDGTYYWHVQPRDLAGNEGPWTETWMFTLDSTGPAAPTLVLPLNNTYTTDTTPWFEWDILETAIEWQLSVSYQPFFSSWWGYATPDDHFNDTSEFGETTVYWRVRGRDSLWNYGPWSETGVIHIDLTEPISPTITGPLNNTITNQSIVTFDWDYLTDTIDYYEIYVSQHADFSVLYYGPKINDSNSHISTGPFADGVYYWKLRAVDLAGNVGNWSETWIYEVDTVPPGIVTLLSPANGAVLDTNTPTFSWNPVVGAVLYRLILVFNNDWSSPIIIVDLNETSFLLPFSIGGAANVFYWNVRAIDAAGNIGGYDPAWTFTIDTIVVPEFEMVAPIYVIISALTAITSVIVLKKRVTNKE